MALKTQAPNNTSSTDRIEKRVVLRAPRSRVWRALTNAEEFSTWFRINLEGAIAEGSAGPGQAHLQGLRAHHGGNAGRAHRAGAVLLVSLAPLRPDPAVDYSAEPTTLVEFSLEEAEGGTALTIVESGFDRIPLARRAEAFRMNDQRLGRTDQEPRAVCRVAAAPSR